MIYHSVSPRGKRLKGKRKGIPGERDRAPKFRPPSLSTNSVWFDFVRLVAATKFCCGDKDFHKNSPVHAKGFVAATCRHNVVPQLVAQWVPTLTLPFVYWTRTRSTQDPVTLCYDDSLGHAMEGRIGEKTSKNLNEDIIQKNPDQLELPSYSIELSPISLGFHPTFQSDNSNSLTRTKFPFPWSKLPVNSNSGSCNSTRMPFQWLFLLYN